MDRLQSGAASLKSMGVSVEVGVKSTFLPIKIERLLLRSWGEEDVSTMHSILMDPEVIRYLQQHKLDQLSQIQLIAEKAQNTISEHGYGYFICEHRETGEVIGMFGLNYVRIEEDNVPCYTVSWILKMDCWGQGYAIEAARSLVKYGFEILKIPEIYACTTAANTSSECLMKRLGMSFVKHFQFPGFEENDPMRTHVLYRITPGLV